MSGEKETSQQFLNSVLAGMKAGLFAIDREARIVDLTARAERLTGFKKDDVLGRQCFEILVTDHCASCPIKLGDEIPLSTLNYETIATTKSGDRLPLDVTISPLRSDSEQPIGVVEILRDMSEQKRLWDNLRQERDRAQQYLQIARVTIVALDFQGRVTLINKKGCELLGYEEDELLGRDWFSLCLPQRIRDRARRAFQQLMEAVRPPRNGQGLPVLTKAGAERLLSWQVSRLRDDRGRIIGLLSSGEDITEREKAQAELIRSEKLAAIGQLAAGVAHEVNNPLAGLLVYFKVLLKKHREGALQSDETEKQLLKMEKETARSSRIIKNLLDFSRQSKPTLRPISVNEAVDAALAIIGHQITLANIELKSELTPDLPPVVADFDQIQQALMNVILNAIQAMPESGSLTITTSFAENVEVADSRRDAVQIDVADSGAGIPEDDVDKIFTPFFSTKPKGQGVGLGLSSVQGIIDRHKGRIAVESSVDVGTTITIWLRTIDEKEDDNPGR